MFIRRDKKGKEQPCHAKGQGLDKGLGTPFGWWIFGQISSIGHTSLRTLVLPFACSAINIFEWGFCETRICILCGFHKSLHVTLLGVTLMSQDASETSCEIVWGPIKWHSNFAFSLFLPLSLFFFFLNCYPKVHIILFYYYLINISLIA